MISDARGGHVSPGIYTEEKDVTYSVKSLGITSLGLVGETLYGPAFENIEVKDWAEYVDYFGGTSTEKFKGTGLPKYELPYVAKSYLEESKKLNVVRVLGLSGYDAGPAWVIAETGDTSSTPVIILRSKNVYGYTGTDICDNGDADKCETVVDTIEVLPYNEVSYTSECAQTSGTSGTTPNYKFSLKVTTHEGIGDYENEYTYNISLNPNDSDYIYKVLSDNPSTGNTPVYIESVYEQAYNGGELKINDISGITECDLDTTFYGLYSTSASGVTTFDIIPEVPKGRNVKTFNSKDGICEVHKSANTITVSGNVSGVSTTTVYKVTSAVTEEVYNDFFEMFRPAQTPWFVSDAVATFTGTTGVSATMRKLFKFITISDGDAANYQVKVSIQNIDPIKGTFDVLVRDFNDDDNSPVILEKFSRCNLVDGDASFIAHKIGTADGGYVSKSKYIAVEMASDEDMSNLVPCGFLGYPMPSYTDNNSDAKLVVKYNNILNNNVKPKRQYFGLNRDILDTDILKYKGRVFYDNVGDSNPYFITNGFHLDSILDDFADGTSDNIYDNKIYVDGVNGYKFTTTSRKHVGSETKIPRLFNKPAYVNETIYKDIATRKFTAYFYGGFDGWDVHRESRTNTDEYKASLYKIGDDKSNVFRRVTDESMGATLNLPNTAITSDYYAYLAGYRVFANPQDIDINVFATPGIDWYNNTLLVEDALEVIEDVDDGRGGDAIYVVNSPRELGVDEIASTIEDTNIDSSYAATFYPWVMYYDKSNKKYLELPVTKDVVRNMAQTDNNSFPWFAPAGMERGNVNCIKAVEKLNINDEDTLYTSRVNPVKSFSQDGVKIWGNKTLYSKESPLNRINVRRLMIRIKKLVVDAAKYLIFEQYDDTLEKQFRGLIEPILADVKANRGLYDYRVVTEVTEETRDQHILPAKILVKPTPALEYIPISFVVYPESVSFDEQ